MPIMEGTQARGSTPQSAVSRVESSRPRPTDSFSILVKDTRRESGHQAMDEKFLYLGQPNPVSILISANMWLEQVRLGSNPSRVGYGDRRCLPIVGRLLIYIY